MRAWASLAARARSCGDGLAGRLGREGWLGEVGGREDLKIVLVPRVGGQVQEVPVSTDADLEVVAPKPFTIRGERPLRRSRRFVDADSSEGGVRRSNPVDPSPLTTSSEEGTNLLWNNANNSFDSTSFFYNIHPIDRDVTFAWFYQTAQH